VAVGNDKVATMVAVCGMWKVRRRVFRSRHVCKRSPEVSKVKCNAKRSSLFDCLLYPLTSAFRLLPPSEFPILADFMYVSAQICLVCSSGKFRDPKLTALESANPRLCPAEAA